MKIIHKKYEIKRKKNQRKITIHLSLKSVLHETNRSNEMMHHQIQIECNGFYFHFISFVKNGFSVQFSFSFCIYFISSKLIDEIYILRTLFVSYCKEKNSWDFEFYIFFNFFFLIIVILLYEIKILVC